MTSKTRPEPGTTEQRPRWEGPEETRPRGYRPAKDDPDRNRDAASETNADPSRENLGDVGTKKPKDSE